ncbi:MAG: 2-hydroxyacyl-CoA dehydratase [Candidatus Fermentithermobacillus carboniphilus]|uniref:2-hydroxyacyl-CoA dehydratase n=1 Tax=Candidatus Fermentithermobacillus carboniphilus TaxID=3085328 RepID=A0AAT9LAY3_9FIRM|nr:MAG: 2-hydroxyacyl-CoA dehydratase [Candidatus Fermentithermobacillus carboniphilus]
MLLLTTCSYIPIEIPVALGIPARRAFPRGQKPVAESYVPRDFCPYSRAVFSLAKELEDTSEPGLVLAIAGSCDAMRRVYDAVRMYGNVPTLFVDVPRTGDDLAVGYFASVLRRFARELAAQSTGQATGEEELEERLWRAIRLLDDLRDVAKNYADMSSSSSQRLEMLFALERYLGMKDMEDAERAGTDGLVEYLVSEGFVPGEMKSLTEDGPPVILTGTYCLDTSMAEALDECGFKVAALDSCWGIRGLEPGEVQDGGDPFLALAGAYLRKTPCPRILQKDARILALDKLLDDNPGIRGIVYYLPKFCDQGYYDYVEVKTFAKRKHLPLLMVEGDYGAGKWAQTKTRLMAFLELLEQG